MIFTNETESLIFDVKLSSCKKKKRTVNIHNLSNDTVANDGL